MTSVGSTRPMRADAARNRIAILAAARETFEADGVYASLDGIAVSAGVGNATLYRNFPTRDDLLAAVIEDVLRAQFERGDELRDSLDPRQALTEWLVQVTWQLRIWNDLPSCLVTASDDGSPLKTGWTRLVERTSELLEAAKVVGAVIDDVDATEVFELVTALSWGIDRYGNDAETARRRVLLATAGIFVPAA